jgi:predicted nucleic acid-binding protein
VIVLDASAALELLLKTPAGSNVERRILSGEGSLHAPHLIDVEVAHVLRRLSLRGVSVRYCRQALDDWLELPLRRYPHDALLDRAWELRANFTADDAAYIALAEELGVPIVTHDRKYLAGGHRAKVEFI